MKELGILIKTTTKEVQSKGMQSCDADDVVQESLLHILETNSDYNRLPHIIQKHIVKFKNQAKRGGMISLNEDIMIPGKTNNQFTKVDTEDLTEFAAEIIQMRQNNLSFKEIAQLLDKNHWNIRKTYERAVIKLKKRTYNLIV